MSKITVVTSEDILTAQEETPLALVNKYLKINRREFLQTVGAGMVALAEGERVKRIKILETPMEKVELTVSGREWKMKGEGNDLGKLHNDVAQAFERELERKIKSGDYTIGFFKTHIGRQKGGKYFLEYAVKLTLTKNPKETHRVIALFGKVWSGTEAKAGARKLYNQEMGRWQKSMEKAYPNVRFWAEEAEAGDDEIYHVACIMKGAKK